MTDDNDSNFGMKEVSMQMKPLTFAHDQFFPLLFFILGVSSLIGDHDNIGIFGFNTLHCTHAFTGQSDRPTAQ